MKIVLKLKKNILCYLIINSVILQAQTNNDLSNLDLKGKVKSIKSISYSAVDKFGEISKGKQSYDIFATDKNNYILFNKSGNKIEEIKYNEDGGFTKEKFSYDNKGNNIKHITYFYDSKGILLLNLTEINKFNKNGKIHIKDELNNKDSIQSKWIYKYDNKGNNTELSIYKSNGELDHKFIYKYDQYGRKIERIKLDSNGKMVSKFVFRYDKHNNRIEEKLYNYEFYLYGKTFKYKYNNLGQQISIQIYDADGNFTSGFDYKYDKKGNIIEKKYFDNEGESKKFTFRYKFDKYGNWLKSTEYYNTIPKIITERKIEYYK